ncbi:MAG: Uncharacterized protein CEO21_96 [Microgenomates group bacterium Gr01-1014_80]|nr:MAG: Uncharacterized protein CEO21_96 [Microgenomates group bacterium Gr01-1014_80]
MTIRYTGNFLRQLKKSDVRIRKAFKNCLLIFTKNPNDPELDNHPLEREHRGHNSINITADYRAIYKEVILENDTYIYFSSFGTHEELYR